jgi:hypothetical protein
LTFLRLNRWDWVAFVAAFALLFAMAPLWWSTKQADECRRANSLQQQSPGGPQSSDIKRTFDRQARSCEAKYDKNAWQADGGIDRLILIVMLAAAASAIAAAFLRAADRRFESPRTPSALAAGLALLGALLVLYRILQPPGFNPSAVIKAGAPIGLACLGVLAIGARGAMMWESERPASDEASAVVQGSGTAAGEEAPEEGPAAPGPEPTPG